MKFERFAKIFIQELEDLAQILMSCFQTFAFCVHSWTRNFKVRGEGGGGGMSCFVCNCIVGKQALVFSCSFEYELESFNCGICAFTLLVTFTA